MQQIQLLPSFTRGNTNIGWLNGFHSFNFGSYFEPTRKAFGPLIILNEDTVQPGTGFGTHPHQNMEIISIPLSGAVTHKDTTGTENTITEGEIQVMSAGTGISHSEYNRGPAVANFLQIWLQPNKKNVAPRYQQVAYDAGKLNQFQQIVSPDENDEGLWIHQSAWLHLGKFDAGMNTVYHLKNELNGVYVFLIEGEALLDKRMLQKRDAATVSGTAKIKLSFTEFSYILIIEVPLS
jgi:redox-sensitive bicupin YhaK (pirin superfamily)